MATSSRLGAAALLVTLGGCESPRAIPPGLTRELHDQVQFCESMDEDIEDWCVFQVLHEAQNLAGEPFYKLCKSMHVTDARDACLEKLARLEESSAYVNLCTEIEQVRLRESCYLMRAEQTMRSAPSIYDVIAACQKTGSLTHHCLGHVPAQRNSLWQSQGGVQALYRDAQAIVATVPESATTSGVGFGFGTAIRDMAGPQGSVACQAFAVNTDARSACVQASTATLGGGGGPGGPTGPGGGIPGGMASP